jgi:hypothetical protein
VIQYGRVEAAARTPDPAASARILDRLGCSVDLWTALPGNARYRGALPGHLAERDRYILALVRIVKETTGGAVELGDMS